MTTEEDGCIIANETSLEPLLVACLVTDKKYRKMGGEEGLKSALQKQKDTRGSVMIKQIHIEELLESDDLNGGFTNALTKAFGMTNLEGSRITLVHKYSDFYRIPGIEVDRIRKLRNWLCYLGNSRVRVLDDPEKIDVLSSRVQTGNLIREMCRVEGFEAMGLQWPEFHVGSRGGMESPVIVKPIDACSTDESHWMTLLNGENGDFEYLSEEVLVQKFYEHFGVLYKVYVIGEEIEIVARPSISARENGPVFRFNTHKFKATAGELAASEKEAAMQRIEPLRELISRFVWRLKNQLQLTWFGVDVLIPEDSAANCGLRAAVIDVNYMPGFDGVGQLSVKVIKAILE